MALILGDNFFYGQGFTNRIKDCIKNNDGAPFLVGPQGIPDEELPRWRKDIAHENVVPSGCYPYEYTWNYCIAYTVPVGYSLLATHPFTRWDLPFVSLTGIVDGGLVMQHNGNFPFYIKEGFEGIIKSGTPMFSIIPIKRAQWTSEVDRSLIEKGKWDQERKKNYFYGYYKKHYRQEKRYE